MLTSTELHSQAQSWPMLLTYFTDKYGLNYVCPHLLKQVSNKKLNIKNIYIQL